MKVNGQLSTVNGQRLRVNCQLGRNGPSARMFKGLLPGMLAAQSLLPIRECRFLLDCALKYIAEYPLHDAPPLLNATPGTPQP